jgi:hypothetical protein
MFACLVLEFACGFSVFALFVRETRRSRQLERELAWVRRRLAHEEDRDPERTARLTCARIFLEHAVEAAKAGHKIATLDYLEMEQKIVNGWSRPERMKP